jgi:hypothetical protein
MKKLFSILVLMLVSANVFAAPAKKKNDSMLIIPALTQATNMYWPTIPRREFTAGVVEQESLMKIDAHLRTSREHGCGIGQFTIAYNKDGSVRFDALEEAKKLDKSLAGWSWSDCANLTYQANATVLSSKAGYRDCEAIMANSDQALKCVGAKHNGGAGSINNRIRKCRAVKGCDPKMWDGNLELHCPQSKTKVAGYGESFCETNSRYPGRVFARMKKYEGKI